MGGLIAQLLWRRHPERVAGLVLCSTTRAVRARSQGALSLRHHDELRGRHRAARAASPPVWYPAGLRPLRGPRPGRTTSLRVWAAGEMRRHDVRQVLEAGHATCQFDSAPVDRRRRRSYCRRHDHPGSSHPVGRAVPAGGLDRERHRPFHRRRPYGVAHATFAPSCWPRVAMSRTRCRSARVVTGQRLSGSASIKRTMRSVAISSTRSRSWMRPRTSSRNRC